VSRDTSRLTASFIERQHQHLIALRNVLVTTDSNIRSDESQVREEIQGSPREYDDDAQKLAALELDGNLVVRDEQRLARVNRAFQKIDEGTYGLSDVSGLDILDQPSGTNGGHGGSHGPPVTARDDRAVGALHPDQHHSEPMDLVAPPTARGLGS
jgi:DnaK suppressor protein